MTLQLPWFSALSATPEPVPEEQRGTEEEIYEPRWLLQR